MQNSKINLTMKITQGFEVSTTKYVANGSFIEKDGKFFLFFDEKGCDDNDITKCRFEISEDSMRLRRNGAIVTEQMHVNNQETNGYIKTPFGHMKTIIKTTDLTFENYHLSLRYDLFINNELTGNYNLKVKIEED